MSVRINKSITECIDGTYGENCTQRCSGNCLKNLPCNKQTGICDNGCIPGYTNKNCSSGKVNEKQLKICIYTFSKLNQGESLNMKLCINYKVIYSYDPLY